MTRCNISSGGTAIDTFVRGQETVVESGGTAIGTVMDRQVH